MASLRRDSLTLLNLAWPVVINRAGILTLSITDTVMVGRYAAEHLAYAGIGMVPSNIYILILIGLLMGTPVLVSNNFGAGKLKQAGAYGGKPFLGGLRWVCSALCFAPLANSFYC